MYLSRVRLEDIRAFDELDLTLVSNAGKMRPWTLLLGDNATGKTTLLRSIAIGLNDQSSAAGLVRELKGSLVRKSAKQGHIYCELIDGKRKWTITTTILPIPRTGDLVTQDVDERSLDSVLSDAQQPSSADAEQKRIERFRKFPWGHLFVVGYGAGRNPEGRDEFDEYRTVDAVYTLFRYDQPLQSPELAWRRALARAKKKDDEATVDSRIRTLLRQVLMLEDRDDISLSDRHIVVTKNLTSTPLSVSADGHKATVTWILDLIAWYLLFSPRARAPSLRGIVLLDEIEQHLHPRWQRYLITKLKKAFPRVQFVGTTHSALCAAGTADLADADCALFRMVFDETKSSIVKEDLPLPRGLKADQILTSEAFGLPETRSPELGDKVDEYRQLVRKEQRSAKDERRLRRLKTELQQKLPSSVQFEDERKLRNELRQLSEEIRQMMDGSRGRGQ